MPAVADLQHARVADVRTAIAEKPRCLGKRGEHVELRERGSGLLNRGELGDHRLAHAKKQFVFEFDAALVRAEDLALHLLQLRRDESLAIGDGLLADVMRRCFVEVGLRHLDVVAEYGVETHFERGDAGPLDLLLLQPGDPFLAFA